MINKKGLIVKISPSQNHLNFKLRL